MMCGNYFNLVLQMMKSRFRMVVCMQLLSDVLLFGLYSTPWILAPKAPLSMEFFRKEYWSKLPSPMSVDLPSPGIEPASFESPALAGGFFTIMPPGKPPPKWLIKIIIIIVKFCRHFEYHFSYTNISATL